MKLSNNINGLLIVILGIGMFIFGILMFSYQGANLSPVVSKLGMYSFFWWLPITIIGIVIAVSKDKNSN